MPVTNQLPKDIRSNRFVQFYIGEDPILRLGEMHSGIVIEFCGETGISYEDRTGPFSKVPFPNDSDVRIAGMGFIYRDPIGNETRYICSGNSVSYGIGPDAEHMAKLGSKLGIEFTLASQ